MCVVVSEPEQDNYLDYAPLFQANSIHAFSILSNKSINKGLAKMTDADYNIEKLQCMELPFDVELLNHSKFRYFLVPKDVNMNGRPLQLLWYMISDYTKRVQRFADLNTIENNREIVLDFKILANKFDVSVQKMRFILEESISTLSKIRWVFHEEIRGAKKEDATDWNFVVLSGIGTTERGIRKVKFDIDFAKYLSLLYVMFLPMTLLKINPQKNPYSLRFADRLLSRYNNNINNEKDPEAKHTMFVESLFYYSKELPSYEEVCDIGHIYKRIVGPYVRDLYRLLEKDVNVLSEIHFIDSQGNEVNDFKRMDLKEFRKLKIWFDVPKYPGLSEEKK